MTDPRLDVEEVKSHAAVQLSCTFSGAPPMKAAYRKGEFLPTHLSLRYVYDAVEASWKPDTPQVAGPMILKPGPNGEQRLGKDYGKRSFYGYDTKEVKPEWLTKLIAELTPSGEVTQPGI